VKTGVARTVGTQSARIVIYPGIQADIVPRALSGRRCVHPTASYEFYLEMTIRARIMPFDQIIDY
jgi:hypothetical protein